jgi:hypothetical protein
VKTIKWGAAGAIKSFDWKMWVHFIMSCRHLFCQSFSLPSLHKVSAAAGHGHRIVVVFGTTTIQWIGICALVLVVAASSSFHRFLLFLLLPLVFFFVFVHHVDVAVPLGQFRC